MKYLLDTNACIHYLNHEDSPVRKRMELMLSDDVVICSVVKAELWFGANKSRRRADTMDSLEFFFRTLSSLFFDDKSALIYGKIRAELATAGRPIGPNDLMIAAIAMANDITLVTHNTGEFSRVKGLKTEDWEISEPVLSCKNS
ncbi:MAG: type II toxin-antitoxin system VapC family toxin [Desulfobacterales bacterium]